MATEKNSLSCELNQGNAIPSKSTAVLADGYKGYKVKTAHHRGCFTVSTGGVKGAWALG